MIEEKLLISYLKKQKREYNEQVVILQKELTSLIERIESGKFDVIENPKKEWKNERITRKIFNAQ